MNERLALTILESLGWHGRGRLKKVLLLRRQELQCEIASRTGELIGLQMAIDVFEESARAE